jgi:hypothetical protein
MYKTVTIIFTYHSHNSTDLTGNVTENVENPRVVQVAEYLGWEVN